jgi:hypothetical protein
LLVKEEPEDESNRVLKINSEQQHVYWCQQESEQQLFGRKLRHFDAGILKPTKRMWPKVHKHEDFVERRIEYLNLHAKPNKIDKCGVS